MNRRAFLSAIAALPLAYLPFLKREPRTEWPILNDPYMTDRTDWFLTDAVSESQEQMAKSLFNNGYEATVHPVQFTKSVIFEGPMPVPPYLVDPDVRSLE